MPESVVRLEDSFKITGPNGEHVCLVFEPLGEALLTVLQQQNYAGLPVAVVKSITKQVLKGLLLLHKACQIIHTDLKPENILLAGDSQWKVKILDFGNACWIHKHFTDDIQTRQCRSPEVILGCDYDEKVDIWSGACIVFELLTGDVLFQPKEARSFTKEEDHIAQIMEHFGSNSLAFEAKRRLYARTIHQKRTIRTHKAEGFGFVAIERRFAGEISL